MVCNYVSSSNLRQVCYDQQVSVLEITFHGGGKYRYSGVPQQVYAGLMTAASHGKYFARFIKGRYPFLRVR